MVGGESFVFGEKTAPPGAITLKLSKKFWERKLGKRRSGQNGRFEREAPPPGAGGTRRLT